MRPFCVTNLEYGGRDQEIQSFDQFLPQTVDFCYNRWLTPINFEQQFENFENP
jgi:hypothetical protein